MQAYQSVSTAIIVRDAIAELNAEIAENKSRISELKARIRAERNCEFSRLLRGDYLARQLRDCEANIHYCKSRIREIQFAAERVSPELQFAIHV